jgi:hypothetical protein
MFPGAIPEENDENDEDDYSSKNYKNSSKKNNPAKISEQINSKNEIKKIKSKSKIVSNFNEKINREKTKKNDEKTKKSSSKSKVSNGLKELEFKDNNRKEKNNDNPFDEENIENLTDYGDELEQYSDSDDDNPKKKKVKEKKTKKKNKKKGDYQTIPAQVLIAHYNSIEHAKTREFKVVTDKENQENKNGRYSLRENPIPTLKHELGERAHYVYENGVPTLDSLTLAGGKHKGFIFNHPGNMKKHKKKKRLKKGGGIIVDTDSDFDYNSELLNSQNISEYGDDDSRFLVIYKGGKKNMAKNYDTLLVIRIDTASGKNMIKVDDKEYKNLKNDDTVKVRQNQNFEILNFSDEDLVVQLLLGNEKNK